MAHKNQFLGHDKYGKPWYVSIKRDNNVVSFFVFEEEFLDKAIYWEDQYIVRADIQKLSKSRAIIEEFRHKNYEKTTASNLVEFYQDDLYQQLCIEELELEVTLPDDDPHPSLSEVIEEMNETNNAVVPNWENRGIGKLLLERIERWAYRAKIHTLFGFLSRRDDVNKLQKMYSKWGWQVRIFGRFKPKSRGYAIGVIIKKRKTFISAR